MIRRPPAAAHSTTWGERWTAAATWLQSTTTSLATERPVPSGSALLCCLLIALSSRVMFETLFVIGQAAPHLGVNARIPITDLTLYTRESLSEIVSSARAYGDYAWYSGVAAHGYTQAHFSLSQQQNWAFFPLQPWLMNLVHGATPQFVFGEVCFLLGIGMFAAWARRVLSRDQLVLATSLLSFSPYAACLSQFRPDSVLFTALAAVLLFSQRRLLLPTLTALVFASLAKPNGFLAVLIAAPHFLPGPKRTAPAVARSAVALALIGLAGASGLVFMSVVCGRLTGNALAWSSIQATFGNKMLVGPARQMLALLRNPRLIGRGGWDFELYDWGLVALVGLSTWNLWRRGALHLALFGAAYVLLTFAGFGGWTMMKHLAASPVMFAGLALAGERTRTFLLTPLSFALGSLFGLTCVAMGAGFAAAWV